MIRIRATVAGREPVTAEGATLAHAVRGAVRRLGLGSGQMRAREQLTSTEWRWDWSGHEILVQVLRPGGPTQPETERTRGQVKLRLSDEASARLEQIAAERRTTRSAVVEGWILGAGRKGE